jgi:hypothetical protein
MGNEQKIEQYNFEAYFSNVIGHFANLWNSDFCENFKRIPIGKGANNHMFLKSHLMFPAIGLFYAFAFL